MMEPAKCLSADLVLAAAQTLTENWLERLVGALAQALSPKMAACHTPMEPRDRDF
jgi:hypothetical protein